MSDSAPTFSGTELEAQLPRLRRYAIVLTGDAVAADDLVQSVALRALKHQDRFTPGTDLRAWLFTIAYNEYISETRRNSRAQRYAREWSAVAEMTVRDRPDSGLEVRDLDRAIANLPKEQQQAVLLVGRDGMRYDEAAAAADVKMGTIRSRVSRGREALRLMTGLAEPRHQPRQPEPQPTEVEQKMIEALIETGNASKVAKDFGTSKMKAWRLAEANDIELDRRMPNRRRQQLVSRPPSRLSANVA